MVNENIPHTLNGQPCTNYQDRDGNFKIETSGIKLLNNEPLPCGGIAEGYFICEVCKQAEIVNVIRSEHVMIYEDDDVTPPDPAKEQHGTVNLHCHNPECSKRDEVILPPVKIEGDDKNAEIIAEATEQHGQIIKYTYTSLIYKFTIELEYEVGEKLQHNYTYSLEPSRTVSEGFDVIGTCKQPECTNSIVVVRSNVPCQSEDTATCIKGGVQTWSYEYEGEILEFSLPSFPTGKHEYDHGSVTKMPTCIADGEITFTCTNGCGDSYTEVISKIDHKYEYKTNSITEPTDINDGLVTIYCSSGCKEEFIDTLPKVVLGDGGNATVISEGEQKIFVRYTHTTKDGVTIILELSIPKQ
jgi:hypothetical protein